LQFWKLEIGGQLDEAAGGDGVFDYHAAEFEGQTREAVEFLEGSSSVANGVRHRDGLPLEIFWMRVVSAEYSLQG
jgi:hypothetical protein